MKAEQDRRTVRIGCPAFCSFSGSLLFLEAFDIVARIEGIEVPAVELIGQQPQVLAEALIMDDLARSEKADRILDVGIVAEAQDIVIGRARLLLSKGFVNMTCR